MNIPTGDSPTITQRPYTLALEHVQWVQEEIEILEKAGIIAKVYLHGLAHSDCP